MADTNAVLQAAQERLGQNETAVTNYTALVGDALQGLFNIADSTVSTGSRVEDGRTVYTTPLQVKTEGIAALEAQNRTQTFAKQIGINSDYAADIQMQLASQMADAARSAMEQGRKVQEMSQVALFDDPLQYMINYVMLPDEKNKLNAHLGVVEQNKAQLAAINQATQQTAITSNTVATKITQANLDDQYRAAEAELANKKAGLYANANMTAAHLTRDAYTMMGDKFQILKDVLQIQRGEEQMAMQREAHAAAREQHKVAAERYADEKKRLEYITEVINKGEIRQYGKPITTVESVKFNWGNNSDVAKQQMKFFNIGAGLKAGLEVSAGDNILERVQFLGTTPPKPGTSENALKVAGLMRDSVAKAMEDNKGAKPEVINAEAQKLFDKQFNNWRLRVDPKDQTNPFSLPGLTTLDQSAEMKSNPAYQYFRTVVKGDEPADIDKMLHTLIPAITNKKVSLDDVVRAVTSTDALSRMTKETADDLYFISGKKVQGIQVPVTYVSDARRWAQASSGVLAGASLATAGTGAGIPAAVGLGTAAAGMAIYGRGATTRLIDPSDATAVKQALISMIMPSFNSPAMFGVGNDALKPVLTKPGVND